MKVAFYSSKRERCGISTYTEHLIHQLQALGVECAYWKSQPPNHEQPVAEMAAWKPQIVHFQHEWSFMPKKMTHANIVNMLTSKNIKSVVTFHTDTEEAEELTRLVRFGKVIVHRGGGYAHDPAVMHMPCPVYNQQPKDALRVKYGFANDAQVISTVGFMIGWKRHIEILELLYPWILINPKVVIQVIAARHFNSDTHSYAETCEKRIAEMTKSLDNRICHVHHYPSDDELLERLALSDMGYTYCPFDTRSSSAAAAMYMSARLPLVATTSSHYNNLGDGVIRAPKEDLNSFCSMVQNAANDAELLRLGVLSHEQQYQQRNYATFAANHMSIYRNLIGG